METDRRFRLFAHYISCLHIIQATWRFARHYLDDSGYVFVESMTDWNKLWSTLGNEGKYYTKHPHTYLEYVHEKSRWVIESRILPKHSISVPLYDHTIIRGLLPAQGLKSLECGSGRADYSNWLSGVFGYQTTCLDNSSEALWLGMHNFILEGNKGIFVNGSVEKLPFPDNDFDVVFCTVLLELFADIGQPLREMVRVLKPGGTFFTIIVSRGFNIQIALNKLWDITFGTKRDNDEKNWLPLHAYATALGDAGLKDINYLGFCPFPTLPVRNAIVDPCYLAVLKILNGSWICDPKRSLYWYLWGRKK